MPQHFPGAPNIETAWKQPLLLNMRQNPNKHRNKQKSPTVTIPNTFSKPYDHHEAHTPKNPHSGLPKS